MKKNLLFLALFILSLGTAQAQGAKAKRAHNAFMEMDYQLAIELYSEVVGKENDPMVTINLAESYRKVGDTKAAEKWYGKAVKMPESESIHKLYYGQMLQANGKCRLARKWFLLYAEEQPDDLRGQYLAKACDLEEELMTKNASIYKVNRVPFNTELDDFSPVIFRDGVVFSSEYHKAGAAVNRTHAWTGKPFLGLFYVSRKKVRLRQKGKNRNRTRVYKYEYGKREKFCSSLNTKFHDAAVCFNKRETEIFLTRNSTSGRDDDGASRLKIFCAQGKEQSWGQFEELPFNSDEYSIAHPALSLDGKRLYFSSDMPGGFGGMDLYYSEKTNGKWGVPSNLGPSINTEGHEVFPYVCSDNKLYFSSNGHIGLGGLDLYSMRINADGSFQEIVNLGHPINSNSDDFSISMDKDGKKGYFSSDRRGGMGGDDIYEFEKLATPVRVLVYDQQSGDPLAKVQVTDECTGVGYTTNAAGIIEFDQRMEACCSMVAKLDAYEPDTGEVCTKGIEQGTAVIVEIPLVHSIEFEWVGRVLDKNDRLPIPGITVTLIPSCGDPVTVTSKADGSYAFKLDGDCCYRLRAEGGEDYIAENPGEHCTQGLKQSKTFELDVTLARKPALVVSTPVKQDIPIPYEKKEKTIVAPPPAALEAFDEGGTPNTYLINIYYDFNKYQIREDAKPELDKIYDFLLNNPLLVVEIGSHTDSRGLETYNQQLSQKRAESVVDYLVGRGIGANRMVAKGYGETVNVNHCANNVPCSEDEHQMNRRTEFKVLGTVNDW